MKQYFILSFILMLCCNTYAQHEKYFPDPDTVIQHRIEEWRDLKFGLLMHWGPYSQWGIVESWSICPEDLSWATGGRKEGVSDSYNEYVQKYEALQKSFNPVNFNPEKWAAAAKYAGMKYMVFTTKHHDGFCMFDTKYTDYKITDSATPFASNPRANITKELFGAFRNQQFWIGAYFSKPDWHSDYYWWKKFPPSDRNCNYSIAKYPEQWEKFKRYTHNQINELVSNFGRVDILWLDGGWVRKTNPEEVTRYLADVQEGSRWARNPQNQDINMELLVQSVRKRQPKILVVDRAVEGVHQNYLTPEQQIPATPIQHPWETCMTMGNSWSYVPNDVYKSAAAIIRNLVDIVSKGGNYLLNIGPGPLGDFDTIAYLRLKEIGDWMKINGEAIYGTRQWKNFSDGEHVRYTQSKDGNTIYVFLFDMHEAHVLLKNFAKEKKPDFRFLRSGKKLHYSATADGLLLKFSLPDLQQLGYPIVLKATLQK